MDDDITLRLDRATAKDLHDTLYQVGEHIAVGSAVTAPTAELRESNSWEAFSRNSLTPSVANAARIATTLLETHSATRGMSAKAQGSSPFA